MEMMVWPVLVVVLVAAVAVSPVLTIVRDNKGKKLNREVTWEIIREIIRVGVIKVALSFVCSERINNVEGEGEGESEGEGSTEIPS